MSRGRGIFSAVLVALGAIAYGASPIDLIPELLTGPLGLVDDLAIWVGAGVAIWKLLSGKAISQRLRRPNEQSDWRASSANCTRYTIKRTSNALRPRGLAGSGLNAARVFTEAEDHSSRFRRSLW